MKILQRYIAQTILTYTAIVMVVILGLDFFIGLLAELRDVGTGDYGFLQAVIHIIFRLPYNLYQFSPMLVLLGGIIGLGLLASNQELMVMRASGVSFRQLTTAVAMAAVIVIVITTLLGELVAPEANYTANKRKQSAENNGQAVATMSGVWVHEGNNFLHIEGVIGKHNLTGVTRYEFDSVHHLLASYFVDSMQYQYGQWQLVNLKKTTFKGDQTVSANFPLATWDLALNPNLLNVGLIDPDEMSLKHLSNYSKHLTQNGLQATSFQFEFWKRVFQPLATWVMILLAIPFVMNNSRTVTMGWRMLLGAMAGFTFYILNAFFGQLSIVYQLSPVVAALFPTLLFAAVGYLVLAW